MPRTRTKKQIAADALLGMMWCGSVRIYQLGNEVVFAETAGSHGNPQLLLRHVLVEDEKGEPVELVERALCILLERPERFPLHGIHWVPPCAGGQGPVILDQPRGPGWEAQAKTDLSVIRARFDWHTS